MFTMFLKTAMAEKKEGENAVCRSVTIDGLVLGMENRDVFYGW
jgi:hypothetical protein